MRLKKTDRNAYNLHNKEQFKDSKIKQKKKENGGMKN